MQCSHGSGGGRGVGNRVKSDIAIMIGDSIVTATDSRFCGLNYDSRMACCLSGARVEDFWERQQDNS